MGIRILLLYAGTVCYFFSSYGSFMVGGWVPYWKSANSTQKTQKYITSLDQVSPFAYTIQKDGSIRNSFRRARKRWNDLTLTCRQHKKLMIPTLSWLSTEEIHNVLSDKTKREAHIDAIMKLVETNFLAGITVNYENIASEDRKVFMLFIESLSAKLHAKDLLFHLTLKARTSDTTFRYIYNSSKATSTEPKKSQDDHVTLLADPVTVSLCSGTGAEVQAYKELVGRCADQVVIMGYDELGVHYNQNKEYRAKNYYVSFCSNRWVDQAIKYALTFIPSEKLVLGVPTYGREIAITYHPSSTEVKKIRSIRKVRSILYPVTQALQKSLGVAATQTPQGEMSFSYTHESGEKRYVIYADHLTIKSKVDLVKKHDIKGIYLFALYGSEDDRMWQHLNTLNDPFHR